MYRAGTTDYTSFASAVNIHLVMTLSDNKMTVILSDCVIKNRQARLKRLFCYVSFMFNRTKQDWTSGVIE